MAYAALAALVQTIHLILNSCHDFISPELKDQIITINEYVVLLQAFLDEFPKEAISIEKRIREATLAAENIIEFILCKQIHHPWYKNICLDDDLHDLNKVVKEIESIYGKVMEIKSGIADVQLTGFTSSSIATAAPGDDMVGRDDDLTEIKDRLFGEASRLEVVPIVGMGGIGKTTLARNAFEDPSTVEHFDICVWATVSQDYSMQEIVSSLLVSIKVSNAKNGALDVYQNLVGRRYLIVLDDVWSTKAWDDLKMMFPDDGNGSRILLTTRLLHVASYANSCSAVHEMRLMDEDQSWDLLRQKVFKQDPCPIELESVGKTIARGCRGLPLAVVVISGLLLTVDPAKATWEIIAQDVKPAICTNDEQLDKILSLSYTRLPHHLRPCILYMATFREDYKVHVSELIRLWAAEGFLKTRFEEKGEEYLEDLVMRNLIMVTKRKSCGRIKTVNMHDLMREMCLRKAQGEKFIRHAREDINSPGCVCSSSFDSSVNLPEGRDRTCCLGYLRLLRIMDMTKTHYPYQWFIQDGKLPVAVYDLFHLRYLTLDYFDRIPAAISNLRNLQILIHKNYLPGRIVELPDEIWRMQQLRHLIIYVCQVPLSFEEGSVFALENLQTLYAARNLICSAKILKMIPNLKKLGLAYYCSRFIDDDICEEGYELHNLVHLQQLEKLRLRIENRFPYPEKVNPAFPKTLKKLSLDGPLLQWKDMNIVGSLPNLEVLKLRHYACEGATWETTEGEFSQLRFLLIHKSRLEHWITESSHFPRLRHLVLRGCPHLRKIPDDIGEIPTLEIIEVKKSNISLVCSALQIQGDQESCGNDTLQVRYINESS